MKLSIITALSVLSAPITLALSLPRNLSPKTIVSSSDKGKTNSLTATLGPAFVLRGGTKLEERANDKSSTNVAVVTSLSMLVVDAATTSKGLALNWGFVLNSGIVKFIGGLLALSIPIFATEVAYGTITLALACVAAFNLAGLFNSHEGFKLQSFLVGAAQAFLAYRMRFRPFLGLNILTMFFVAASMADGIYETAVALRSKEFPGRRALLFSGIASIVVSVVVTLTLPASSLVVLGVLLGVNLLSSGWSGILSGLRGREIANSYLKNVNFEKDVHNAITAAKSK